jgi:protein SCO1/2
VTTAAGSFGGRRRGAASRAIARTAAVLLFVAAGASVLFWSLRRPLPPAPPVIATLPAFELTDQAGRPFGSKDLEGRVWVASFIFTRCDSVCPTISARMARIQPRVENLGSAFHLVSFSADPEYDTPARLAEYAKTYRARSGLWSFLTGSPVAMREIAVQGLKMSLGDERSDDERFEGIFHDTHLVLVDRKGRVRAYYDSQDEKVIDAVVRDARLLVSHDR